MIRNERNKINESSNFYFLNLPFEKLFIQMNDLLCEREISIKPSRQNFVFLITKLTRAPKGNRLLHTVLYAPQKDTKTDVKNY